MELLRGECTFDLMGRNFTCSQSYVPVSQVESRFAFHGENGFKMVKIYILSIELCAACTLTTVPNTCWVGVSVLQHELLLNHPLGPPYKDSGTKMA